MPSIRMSSEVGEATSSHHAFCDELFKGTVPSSIARLCTLSGWFWRQLCTTSLQFMSSKLSVPMLSRMGGLGCLDEDFWPPFFTWGTESDDLCRVISFGVIVTVGCGDVASRGIFPTPDASRSRKGKGIGTVAFSSTAERVLSSPARRILVLRVLTGGGLDCPRRRLPESRRACSMVDVIRESEVV